MLLQSGGKVKTATIVGLAVACLLGSSADANDECLCPPGSRVPYSIDLHLYQANPSQPITSPLDLRNYAGSGRILKEWKVVERSDHVYKISGLVISDNAGTRGKGTPILIGNIEVSDRLTLMTRTDDDGHFEILVDNGTYAERKRRAEAAAEAMGTKLISYGLGEDPTDHATIYRNRKYLYIGDSGIDLYRYEIPYDKTTAPMNDE
jgi:hypothetical protein